MKAIIHNKPAIMWEQSTTWVVDFNWVNTITTLPVGNYTQDNTAQIERIYIF